MKYKTINGWTKEKMKAAIDAESIEATNYVSLASFESAFEALRQGLPGKAWDDVMVAEQRLISGIMPTRQELGL